MSYGIKLQCPFNLIVSGQTQAGKSRLCLELLQKWQTVVDAPIGNVLWLYGLEQPELFDQIRIAAPSSSEVFFQEGFQKDAIKAVLAEFQCLTIFIDDLNREAFSDPYFGSLFDRVGHHSGVNIIALSQNLFDRGKYFRHAMLNCKYLILMSSVRDSGSLAVLNRQVFPDTPGIIASAFQQAMALRPYGHLLIDLSPNVANELRLRANIFDESPVFFVNAQAAFKRTPICGLDIYTFAN